VKFSVRGGVKFNDQIYAVVRSIPRGKVLTYGRVAMLLNVPRGARAVGWALHALPAGTDVPWHRVINAQGGISIRGNPLAEERQRELLEAEDVKFDESGHVRLEKSAGIMWTPSPWEIQEILDHAGQG
jgi:methylated-DNA-protein-cysteine methyltransferase-like protein